MVVRSLSPCPPAVTEVRGFSLVTLPCFPWRFWFALSSLCPPAQLSLGRCHQCVARLESPLWHSSPLVLILIILNRKALVRWVFSWCTEPQDRRGTRGGCEYSQRAGHCCEHFNSISDAHSSTLRDINGSCLRSGNWKPKNVSHFWSVEHLVRGGLRTHIQAVSL